MKLWQYIENYCKFVISHEFQRNSGGTHSLPGKSEGRTPSAPLNASVKQ